MVVVDVDVLVVLVVLRGDVVGSVVEGAGERGGGSGGSGGNGGNGGGGGGQKGGDLLVLEVTVLVDAVVVKRVDVDVLVVLRGDVVG